MAHGFGSDSAGLQGCGASLGIGVAAMQPYDAASDVSPKAARFGATRFTGSVSGMSLASRLLEKGPFDATRG